VERILDGIVNVHNPNNSPSQIQFYLENEKDIKPPFYINIKTFDGLGRGSEAGVDRDSSNITDRQSPANVAQRENRRVPITYGDEPQQKLVPVPNPASPDRTPVGNSTNPKVITAADNPSAIPHIKAGGGGAVFQVPVYVPNDAVGSGGKAEIKCQVKVYDLVGNLVSSGENDKVLQSSARLFGQAEGYASMDLFWSGFNSKGMKSAPGTYRIIVYISYVNTTDTKAKNKKLQGTIGIGK
jgi:hypothetical protein